MQFFKLLAKCVFLVINWHKAWGYNELLLHKQENAISSIIYKFSDYEFYMHFDNDSKYYLDMLFKGEKMVNTAAFFFNYDLDMSNARRPTGYKYVHVVFLRNPLIFERFSRILFNLEYVDVVLYIMKSSILSVELKNYVAHTFWVQKYNKRAGTVMLFDYDNKNGSYVHFYSGNKTGLLQTIHGFDNVTDFTVFVNNFLHFHGHVFDIAFSPIPPYFWCRHEEISKCHPEGIEGSLLLALSEQLNFTYNLINFEKQLPTPWPAMINSVHRNEVDFAIGAISRTTERMLLVDFSLFLKIDGFGVLFSSVYDDFNHWNTVLLPFDIYVWFLLLSISLAYALVLTKSNLILSKNNKRKYTEFLAIMYKSIVEQSEGMDSDFSVVRLLFSCWSLTCIIITTAYKSKLAAFMTITTIREPDSIMELLDENYYFQVDQEDWSLLKFNLEQQTDSVYKKIVSRCRNNLDVCDAIESTFGEKIANIDETTTLHYRTLNVCVHLSKEHDFKSLRFARQTMFKIIYAWPFQLNSAVRMRFSEEIGILHASGHITNWFDNFVSNHIIKSNQAPVDHNSQGLNLETFIGPGLIYLIGIFISILAFVYEIVYYKWFSFKPMKSQQRTKNIHVLKLKFRK